MKAWTKGYFSNHKDCFIVRLSKVYLEPVIFNDARCEQLKI